MFRFFKGQIKKSALERIAKRYGLELVLLFGSRASGKAHQNSDVDIAVLARRPIGNRHFVLLVELSKIFPEAEVDLVLIERADPLLLKKILENCQLLFGEKKDLASLKALAFKKYCDYGRYFDIERKFVKNFLSRPIQGPTIEELSTKPI